MQDPQTKVHFVCVWLHSLSNVLVHVRLNPRAERPNTFCWYFTARFFLSLRVIETTPTFCSKNFKRLCLSGGRWSRKANGLWGQIERRWFSCVYNDFVASCPSVRLQRVSRYGKFRGATRAMLSPASWTSSETSVRFCPVATAAAEKYIIIIMMIIKNIQTTKEKSNL